MKKFFWYIPMVLAIGIAASFLRAQELAYGFDPVNGLPIDKTWVTPLLVIVGIALAAIAVVFVGKGKIEASERKKSVVFTGISFLCCAIMLALSGYAMHINEQKDKVLTLFAVMGFLNAISFAILGAKNLEDKESPVYSVVAFLPILWATIAVIMVFRERVSEPVAQHFVFMLFAFLAILLFIYAQLGYVYGKNRFTVAVAVGVLGIFFGAIELIAPFVAQGMSINAFEPDMKIALSLLTYLIYIPAALFKMLRNENRVGCDDQPADGQKQ